MTRSTVLGRLCAGALFATCAAAIAGGAHAAAAPDLNGVWVIADSFMDRQDGSFLAAPGRMGPDSAMAKEGKFFAVASPKLKGDYAKRQADALAGQARGEALESPGVECIPSGMPGFWGSPYYTEILQTAKQINLFNEGATLPRRVYLDGRKHPSLDDDDPLYNGHSTGRWEGDTLVIDTVNLVATTPLAGPGAGHSDKMHITERIRRTGPDLMEVKMTVEDPLALEEPWVTTRKFRLKPGAELREYICQENNRPEGK